MLTETTAEMAIALTLALLRRVGEGDRFVRRREPWAFSVEFMLGESLRGKTFGVVGPGRIGRAAAARSPRRSARRPSSPDGTTTSTSCWPPRTWSAFTVPLTAETRHLIDAAALERMRETAVLVNTARGQIVDEQALVAALRNGTIAGAALDVYEREPDVSEELLALENVVLTPHLGSATRETREAMGLLAVSALRAVLVDGTDAAERRALAGGRVTQRARVPELVGPSDQLRAAMDAELAQQVLDVCRHGLLADHELHSNLFLPATFDEEVQDLDLSAGELRGSRFSERVVTKQRLAIDEPSDPATSSSASNGFTMKSSAPRISPATRSRGSVRRPERKKIGSSSPRSLRSSRQTS